MPTFPVYILDLAGVDRVVFPEDQRELSHSEFWTSVVAKIVADHFHLPTKRLLNLPYCQRRARIVVRNDEVVYFGERHTKKLLKLISKSVGLSELQWRFDEHEQRLDFDVTEFNRLLES